MTKQRLDAAVLLDMALAAYRAEILPTLAPDRRYLGAMIANALEIARRELDGEPEAAEWALLDPIYGEGEGSMARLAEDLRAGRISEVTHPDLRARLKTYLVADLKVRNPRFLNSRRG